MKPLPTSKQFYAVLAMTLLLTGCFSDTRPKEDEPSDYIPEITKLMRGHENAMAFYWIYRTQAKNIRQSGGAITPNDAQAIGQTIASYMENEDGEPIKGTVDGLESAIKKHLAPWGGKNMKGNQWSEDALDGYCDKLMQIAESCRRAAK